MTEPVQALRDGEPVIAVGYDKEGCVVGAQLIRPETLGIGAGREPTYAIRNRLKDVAERWMVEEAGHFAYGTLTLEAARKSVEALGYCLVQAHDGDGHPDGLTGAMQACLKKDAKRRRFPGKADLQHAYEAVTGEEVNG